MNALFQKMGFHKMDEMEKEIASKARRNALLFVEIIMLIWMIYSAYEELVHHTDINLTPCYILIGINLVEFISRWYLERRMVRGDEEYTQKNTGMMFLFLAVFIAALILIFKFIIILHL